MMNVHRFVYVMVHLVTPLTYFIASIVWGHFVLSKDIWVNLSDNLSIMGIYYVIASILWVSNMKTIDKVVEKLKNDKKAI
uniref:hypothetical protein n=1 Tax=Bacillus sp. DX2.2 TaxID=3073452 RepID=UPI00402AE7DC